ncbi:hypothetical protein [Okeania sp. KiyG1]|uniref:hypothetical protein n=1 Tax=Okeania sp. KiyG1 TaxID=2720165 RepID=UPI001921031E|nr:hypothetical protein [Okeania sp. KiyG1]GGA06535.1 hypothetical protein CYANOKiyG1_18940 [Okeania sp. KiyG1]
MPQIPQYLTKSDKSKQFQKLINEALYIISKFGVPLEGMTQRRLERMAMAYFSYQLSVISYQLSIVPGIGMFEILNFLFYPLYESSYDDIRRKDLKLIVLAGIIIPSATNPNSARNDGTRSMDNE